MDWDCGFSASSYQQFMMDEGEMEEFRSEKSVKAGKVREKNVMYESLWLLCV